MRDKTSIKQLLLKYHNNQCRPDEIGSLMQRLRNEADDEEILEAIDEIYSKDQNGFAPNTDSEIIWQKIAKEARSGNIQRGSSNRTLFLYSTAAVIVLLVAFTFTFQYLFKDTVVDPPANAIVTKQTDKGSKLNTYLPDGTKIKLNALSSIQYDENFLGHSARVVHLKGEAFFEVEHMPEKPFKVITGDVTTTVLGTSFNINAYETNNDIQVAVASGKVSVGQGSNEVSLNPNEMALCRAKSATGSGEIQKTVFEVEAILGWKDNLLIINDLKFDEIIRKLERWYGVEIELSGNKQIKGTFTHRYNNESLEVVLEGLSFSAGFEYEIVKGDKVIIKY